MFWYARWIQKNFFSQYMNDDKAGGPIEKSNLWGVIFALKLWLWVTLQKRDKIQEWSHTLLSLLLRYVYRIQKSFLLPTYERRQSTRPYRETKLWSIIFGLKVRVVGYPKMIKFLGGRLLCCRWCSNLFWKMHDLTHLRNNKNLILEL